MTGEEWEALRTELIDQRTPSLAASELRDIYDAAHRCGPEHPLTRLLSRWFGEVPPFVRTTDAAFRRIFAWLERPAGSVHRGWWTATRSELCASAPKAAGTLAEVRALGSLLSTHGSPTGGLLPAPVQRSDSRTPDFVIGGTHEVFVEVCCARMNDSERARQGELDEAEVLLTERGRAAALQALDSSGEGVQAMRANAHGSWQAKERDGHTRTRRHDVATTAVRGEDGSTASFAVSLREVRPQGPAKGLHTVASILNNKKPTPEQVPEGKPGVLWMDLCDPEWSIRAKQTSAAEVFWLDISLATTHGIWHSFYGRRNHTLMMERAAVGIPLGIDHVGALQPFDGRFRNEAGRRWSAAVLRCVDGLVVFEHPDPLVSLPFSVLREIVALEGYRPAESFHRLSEGDFGGLSERLGHAEHLLEFYAGETDRRP